MRVVLATDGSDDAAAATEWLAAFPLPADARLRVVSAVSVPISALDLPTVHEFRQSMREEATRVAEAARSALAPRFKSADVRVVDGEARPVILGAAEPFYLDFVEAENSTGFHAPQEAARILGGSIDFTRQGQLALRDVRPR